MSRGGTAPGMQIATHMSLQPEGLKGVEARREARSKRDGLTERREIFGDGGKRRIQTDADSATTLEHERESWAKFSKR